MVRPNNGTKARQSHIKDDWSEEKKAETAKDVMDGIN